MHWVVWSVSDLASARRQTHNIAWQTHKELIGHFILSLLSSSWHYCCYCVCCLCCCNHSRIGKLAHFCLLYTNTNTQKMCCCCFKSNHSFNMPFKFLSILSPFFTNTLSHLSLSPLSANIFF